MHTNSSEEKKIIERSQGYIRKNEAFLYEKFANPAFYFPDTSPVTLFMAGSPGAGKTETSKKLLEEFRSPAVRIDADEIRSLFPEYTGDNSALFQPAASAGVELLYAHCLEKSLNVLMDGTFAHSKTVSNIERSLQKQRKVVLYFIYQDPLVAWDFTQKREFIEGRRITKDMFIRGFCMSRLNVNEAKKAFGTQIELNLIVKDLNNDSTGGFYKNVGEVDSYLKKVYTEDELKTAIT